MRGSVEPKLNILRVLMFSHGNFGNRWLYCYTTSPWEGEPLVISYNRWVCRDATHLSYNRRGFVTQLALRITGGVLVTPLALDITGGSVVTPLALGKEWVTGYSQCGCCSLLSPVGRW